MPIFNDYANGKPLKEIDYFIDKIYVDDDGNLSFVIKRYGKDGTKLVETSADELIENQGFTRFDNFTLCSTQNPREKSPGFFFAMTLSPFDDSVTSGYTVYRLNESNRREVQVREWENIQKPNVF
ncbi:MAG: hypothetical protein J6J41_07860 [Clostridia bacterium]|nr:hypothetical protein [Clostridia bacterium]